MIRDNVISRDAHDSDPSALSIRYLRYNLLLRYILLLTVYFLKFQTLLE